VVVEMVGDLEDEPAQHVRGHAGVRGTQERHLLGQETPLATDLVRAGETVENRVDVRESGVEGG
jgi:hypothetical protein